MTELRLPFPPSTNNLFLSRGKKRIRTERYREWAIAAGWELKAQRPKRVRGPVAIELSFEDKDLRRRDLDNLAKGPLDLLTEHKIIEADDKRIVRELTLRWDAEITGCKVRIHSLAQAQQAAA